MSIRSTRSQGTSGIAEKRFIRKVLQEEGENIFQSQNKRMSKFKSPSIVRNNLNSAKALSESDRDIQIILYSGLKNGKNETETNKDLLWPELYKRYWKKWLNFRINSDTFIWKFNAKK